MKSHRLSARLKSLSWWQRFAAAAAATAVVAAGTAGAYFAWPPSAPKHLTAYFPETTGLYTGDKVQVAGVPVGTVDSITQQPSRVKVVISYDSDVKIPAGAKAAIVTPTLVTTRTVQLTPAYLGSGPVLADNAVIPEPRTAVPVEWDQIEKELNTLITALGPQGGSSGALNQALNTAAANLNGNGQTMHDTLGALSSATTTLSDDKGDLFATLENLKQFIAVLQQSNGQVGDFESQLNSVSGVLDSDKQQLATVLSTLDSSLGAVSGFIKSNRNSLSANLASLNSVVANIAKSDQTLADILQVSPTELANFNNIYDPVDHSITGALALTNFQDPAEFTCSTIFSVGASPAQCQQSLSPYLNLLKMSSVPVTADPLNRDAWGSDSTSVGSASSSSGQKSSAGLSGLGSLLTGGGGS